MLISTVDNRIGIVDENGRHIPIGDLTQSKELIKQIQQAVNHVEDIE